MWVRSQEAWKHMTLHVHVPTYAGKCHEGLELHVHVGILKDFAGGITCMVSNNMYMYM